jgi:hypothetical protein
MDLRSIVEALQSSTLAVLLPGLENVRATPSPDGSGRSYVVLPIRQVFGFSGESNGALLIREMDFHWHFFICVFVTDQVSYAAQHTFDINQSMETVRASYMIKDGEFIVDWALGRRPGWECSLGEIEHVIASLLLVYFVESFNFNVNEIGRQSGLVRSALQEPIDATRMTLEAEIVPLLTAVRSRQ